MVTLHEELCTFMKISRLILLVMTNVEKQIYREYQNTQFVFKTFFLFRKSFPLWNSVVKYGRTGQDTDDTILTTHAHCLLLNYGYTHTIIHTEYVESRSNVMAHGDAREVKWRGNWGMEFSQYPSHCLGTWCIQHYYRWCSHPECQ